MSWGEQTDEQDQELEEYYRQPVMFEAAVKDMRQQHPSNRFRQFW